MATRWTIGHSLILLGFKDLMNVTEEVTIHRPNVSTLLSSAFISLSLSLMSFTPNKHVGQQRVPSTSGDPLP